jgi:flagellar hook-associated protein 2
MGTITSGVGLISGINSAQLIQQLLAVEARGRTSLQQRVASLTSQRTALLDVNARLLNLKNSASKFRIDKVFQSSLAVVSDEGTLSATAGNSTPAGTYQFFVNRLASTSQLRTKGFATSDSTPLGLDALRFEFGDIGVRRSVDLAALNGGEGVRRGKVVITDKSGASSTVDLSSTTTLESVVAAINDNEDIAVTASIVDERLRIVDTSGGSGSLKVANAAGSNTATDLGIATTTAGTTITSSQINRLGASTALASLNDGLGVFIRDDAVDFRLQVGSSTFDIQLGREDLPITTATKLADLNNGVGIKINTTDAPDFKIRTTTGTLVDINLGAVLDDDGNVDDPAVETVQQMLSRVNATLASALGGPGQVVMSLRSDGKGFVLTDTMGGSDPVRVLGAGPNADTTAQNLGIFTGPNSAGTNILTGQIVKNQVKKPRAATIQDVIDRISEQTSGAVTAAINGAGNGLSLSAGGQTITVLAGSVDGSSQATAVSQRTARDLGIFQPAGTTIAGARVLSGLGTILARNINGGNGLAPSSSVTIADRAGNLVTVNNLETFTTLEAVVAQINSQAASAGVGVALSIDGSNSALRIDDSSGGTGTLTVGGSGAAALGINGTGNASGVLRGRDLEIKYVSEAQALSKLNYGRGVGTGRFRMTDSAGNTANVDIDADSVTLYDVVREINSRGLFIEARLNEAGDGIKLFDTNTGSPQVKMKIENVNGGVAAALGILGEASAPGQAIDGSYEKLVDLDPTDTLKKVVDKIKSAGIPVVAGLVNTGSGGTPFYLTLGSGIGGKAGRLSIDSGGVDLGLTTLSEGQDAEILFGNGDPALGLALRSSTNLFEDVVGGLDVTAKKTSTTAVSVDVSRNVDQIRKQVTDLVTSFNDAIGRINDYDSYDIETEKRGILLGNGTLARTRQLLYSTIQGRAKNVDGQFQFLSQVGIRVGKDGQIQLDQAKFDAAYESDPEAVERLFDSFDAQTVNNTTSIPGVTIGGSTTVKTTLGFGDLINDAVNALTNSIDGAFTRASSTFQGQIDRLNDRIEAFDARLERRRGVLERQFLAMEEALARLQNQQSSIGSIASIGGLTIPR